MTLKQFMVELTRAIKKLDVVRDKSYSSRVIRFCHKGNVGEYCPITLVVESKTQQYYDTYDYNLAAQNINLPDNIANDIMMAADFPKATPTRKLLLKACRPK